MKFWKTVSNFIKNENRKTDQTYINVNRFNLLSNHLKVLINRLIGNTAEEGLFRIKWII